MKGGVPMAASSDLVSMEDGKHSIAEARRRFHLYELESAQDNLARNERLIEEQQERMRRLAQIGCITPASEHLLTLLKTSREAYEHYILSIERELGRGE
jgi:hypothetical protein